ncbi:hypothetical protein D3C80_913350 [compost metagenome]
MKRLYVAAAFGLISVHSAVPEDQAKVEGGYLSTYEKVERWTEENPDTWRGMQASIENLGGGKPKDDAMIRALEALGAGAGEEGWKRIQGYMERQEAEKERLAAEKVAAEQAAAEMAAAQKAAADSAAADQAKAKPGPETRLDADLRNLRNDHATPDQIKEEKKSLGSMW